MSAAEPLDVAQARGVQHRAGAAEQQALQQAWLTQWKSAAVSARAASNGQAVGAEQQGEAEADGDDADVLDRRIGEQRLEVALEQRRRARP